MKAKSSNASGGLGLGGALFLVFLVLKLLGKIDWEWKWVTAPLWGPFALVIGFMVIALVVIVVKEFFS